MNSHPQNDSSACREAVKLVLIYDSIQFYYLRVAAPIGIVFNALAILIFTHKSLNKTNMGFYNTLIALANMLVLLFYMFVQNSMLLLGIDLTTASYLSCPLIYFFRRTIRELPPMIETLVTVDRFLNVFYIARFRAILQSKRFILTTILFIYLIVSALSFENLLYHLSPVNNETATFHCTASPLVSISADLISSLLRNYLPSTAMIVLNVFIINKLKQSKSKSNSRVQSKESDFTRSVVSLNFVFMAFNLPESIVYLIKIVFDHLTMCSDVAKVRITFMFQLAYFISTFYYMAFFFTNLMFNKLFRRQVFKLLTQRMTSEGQTRQRNSSNFSQSRTDRLASFQFNRRASLQSNRHAAHHHNRRASLRSIYL
jgi:hypothetical protein